MESTSIAGQTILRYELSDRIHPYCMFVTAVERALIKRGAEDGGRKVVRYVPNNFHQATRLLIDEIGIDTFVVTVSPMDRHGYFSFGTGNDYSTCLLYTSLRVAASELDVASRDERHGASSLRHATVGERHAGSALRVGRWLLPCRSEDVAARRGRVETLFVRRAALSLQPASRRLFVERTQVGPCVSQRGAGVTEAESCVTQARTCDCLLYTSRCV